MCKAQGHASYKMPGANLVLWFGLLLSQVYQKMFCGVSCLQGTLVVVVFCCNTKLI